MNVGLIDVDSHNYPNLALMKISAWHKAQGDHVEWYNPWVGYAEPYDKVYVSKVFTFTDDYDHPIYAKTISKGGTGYDIRVVDGKEIFAVNIELPKEIEHIYPDYSLYPQYTRDTAYGFLTRGCPRDCGFCHTTQKDGRISRKVADLSEFWDGQKNIICRELRFAPYVMIYDKEHCDRVYRRLQRWVNNKYVFWKCENFQDYKR